jgi:hypothetical protein
LRGCPDLLAHPTQIGVGAMVVAGAYGITAEFGVRPAVRSLQGQHCAGDECCEYYQDDQHGSKSSPT